MTTRIGQKTRLRGPSLDLKPRLLKRMRGKTAFGVWTPVDFLDLGPRAAVDKALPNYLPGTRIVFWSR